MLPKLSDLSPDMQRMLAPFAPVDSGRRATQGDGSAPEAIIDAGAVGISRLRLVIAGEPASKGNSRQIVRFGPKLASIKSPKARAYERNAIPQAMAQARRVGWRVHETGRMRVEMRIFYATERPDLDESVVLDILQGIAYANDRQVREKHVYHAIDAKNPRAEIIVEPMQGDLL